MILAVIETIDNKPVPGSLEVLGLASGLSGETGAKIRVVVPVSSAKKWEDPFREAGFSLCLMENETLSSYNHEVLVQGLAELAGSLNPRYICFPGTVFSGSAAPLLASLMSAPYIASVEKVKKTGDGILFTRPTHGEKYLEDIVTDADTSIISARPGSFTYKEGPVKSGSEGDVTVFSFTCREKAISIEEVKYAHRGRSDIERAEVIVTAGRGAGDEDGIIRVENLGALFRESAVGATRPVQRESGR